MIITLIGRKACNFFAMCGMKGFSARCGWRNKASNFLTSCIVRTIFKNFVRRTAFRTSYVQIAQYVQLLKNGTNQESFETTAAFPWFPRLEFSVAMSRHQLSDTVAIAKAALRHVELLLPVVVLSLEKAEKVGGLATEFRIKINARRPEGSWKNNSLNFLCPMLMKYTSFVRDALWDLQDDVNAAQTVAERSASDLAIEVCENGYESADELMDRVKDIVSTTVKLFERLQSIYPAYSHEKVQIVQNNWTTMTIPQLSSALTKITEDCNRTARDACAQFFELDHMNNADKYYDIFLSISGAIRNEALGIRSCFAEKLKKRMDKAAQKYLAAVEKKTLHYDSVFVDESGLQPGERLYGALDVALERSTLFVALIDDTYHSKLPAVRELVNAILWKKPVLIVYLPGSDKDALIKSSIFRCSRFIKKPAAVNVTAPTAVNVTAPTAVDVKMQAAVDLKGHLDANDFPGWVEQIGFIGGTIGDNVAQMRLAELIYSFFVKLESPNGKPTVHAALAANFNFPLRIYIEPVPVTAPNFDQLTHRRALCDQCAAELSLDIVDKLEESNMAIFWCSDIMLEHPEIDEHCVKFDAMVEKFNMGGMTEGEWAAMMQLNSNLADFKHSNDGIRGFLLHCISTRLRTCVKSSGSWMNIHRALFDLKCKRMKKYFMVPVFDLAAHGSDEIKSHKGISYYSDEKLREWFTHCAKYGAEDGVSDAVALLKTLQLLKRSNLHDPNVVNINLTKLQESMQGLADDCTDSFQDLFDAVNGMIC